MRKAFKQICITDIHLRVRERTKVKSEVLFRIITVEKPSLTPVSENKNSKAPLGKLAGR